MIIKHVRNPIGTAGSFRRLVKYITQEAKAEDRVALNNLGSNTVSDAISEAEITQGINTRRTTDATYHLVVSFAAGERPSAQQLRVIEQRVCDSIGLGVHQRVSAVHDDTDHMHIHIAVNTVHPTKFTNTRPYKAYSKLYDVAREIEIDLGISRLNDVAEQRIESLKPVMAEALKAKTWEGFMESLNSHGVVFQKRGNGAVLVESGVRVKASAVEREYSLAHLTERFGAFPTDAAPAQSRELFAEYRAASTTAKTDRVRLKGECQAEINAVYAAAKRRATFRGMQRQVRDPVLKRNAAPSMVLGIASTLDKAAVRREVAAIRDRYKERTAAVTVPSFDDWLRNQSGRGRADATAALRRRRRNTELANVQQLVGMVQGAMPAPDLVTPLGTHRYVFGRGTVDDDGQRLVVRDADDRAMAQALKLAATKFGGVVTAQGDKDFQERVARVAAAARIPLVFQDVALEARRQQHEALINGTRRRRLSGSAGDDRNRRGSSRRNGGIPGQGPAKPGFGFAHSRAAPKSLNSLRGLSMVNLAQRTQSGARVLPADEHRAVVDARSDTDRGLRRAVSVGVIEHAAAMKYIDERNSKRAIGLDVAPHRFAKPGDLDGTYEYLGSRTVQGVALTLLLEKGADEVIVTPLGYPAAPAIGTTVRLSASMQFETVSRSRR